MKGLFSLKGKDILPQRPEGKWGDLQSCEVKWDLDGRVLKELQYHDDTASSHYLLKTRWAKVLFCVYELIRDSLTFRATRPWVWDLKVWAINIKFPLWSPRWRVVRAALFYGALIISPRVSNGARIWLLGDQVRSSGQVTSYQNHIFVAFQHCWATIRTLTGFREF